MYNLRKIHEHTDTASSTSCFIGAHFFDFQASCIFVAVEKASKCMPGTFPFLFFASSKKIIVATKMLL